MRTVRALSPAAVSARLLLPLEVLASILKSSAVPTTVALIAPLLVLSTIELAASKVCASILPLEVFKY